MSDKGYVYVLSNPAMPGVYKVGKSIHGGKKRAKELATTGVPESFQLVFEIYCCGCSDIKEYAHELLGSYRVRQNREFFNCTESQAVIAVTSAAMDGYLAVVSAIDKVVTTQDISELVITNDLKITNPDWQMIRSLILRFFRQNSEALSSALNNQQKIKDIF